MTMKIREIGIFEAKTCLSEILEQVEKGVRFIITKRRHPIAELRTIKEEKQPLERGCAANPGYRMSPDFNEPLEDFREYP
jgi:antitoxin (DNA-binding transcriptional repressor) of toxin-antitoxin stability system